MAETRQKLRGTTAQLDAITSLPGHLAVDTTNWTLRLFDGVTAGGHKILNSPLNDLRYLKLDGSIPNQNALGGTLGIEEKLRIYGVKDIRKGIYLKTADVDRFYVGMDNSVESLMSDAGGDFEILTYTTTGIFKHKALAINRSSGQTTTKALAADSLNVIGTSTLNGTVTISNFANVGQDLTVTGDIFVSSDVTAAGFFGSGAGLTGLVDAALPVTIVRTSRTLTAGDGLTGGGAFNLDRTITLGTPGSVTGVSANAVSTTSHTHAFAVPAQTLADLYSTIAGQSVGIFTMLLVTGVTAYGIGSAVPVAQLQTVTITAAGAFSGGAAPGGATWRNLNPITAGARVGIFQRLT